MSITKISPSVVDFDAGITISTTDNTSNLILTSTDADANIGPVLELYRNSSSPADNDELARIYFYGENDNDEKIEYALIKSNIVDASDGAEGSSLQIYTYSTGGQRNRIDLLEGETVFNEGSQDLDFRVESDGNANMFFVDGGNNRVGIGTNAPDYKMHIYTGDSGASAHANADDLFIESSGNAGMTIASGTSSNGSIFFADSDSTIVGQVEYNHADNLINLIAGGSTSLRVSSTGLLFGGDTAASNTLHDYEEGSFTIGIDGGTLAAGTTTAYYVKVGQMVWFYWYSGGATINSPSGNATLTGLPYTANGTGYTMFHYLHGTGVDGNTRGGYVNVSNTNAVFVDEGATSLATYNSGSVQIMVQGMITTDS